ncbi:hypothetical protein [Citrobacter sp. U14242]|uniref:hypothetical protein n=1 Tax=Citrobacter sp. U14242 TaxID=3390192 RepID=UPI00397E3A09
MRNRTRHHITDLPSIGLPFLANIRRMLVGASPEAQLSCQTVSGTLWTTQQADGYAMTINGVTRLIRISLTDAGYGVRQWYTCPCCGKRVAKLYIGEKDIACRKCWNLHYASQSEDRLGRMRMKIRRQRYAIWGNTKHTRNLANHPYSFLKPKGMRWETFNKKVAVLVRYESAYWQAFAPVIDKICGRVDRSSTTN